MLDFGTVMAITTAIAVQGYFDDKNRIEQERRNEYKQCFDSIGDNVSVLGNLILETFLKSSRLDLLEIITRDVGKVPLHIFMEVIRKQGKPMTEYQKMLVQECIKAFEIKDYTESNFVKDVQINTDKRATLYHSVSLSEKDCGEFWKGFIEIIYETEMDGNDFQTLISSYGETVFRFAVLGDCDMSRAQSVFDDFIKGLRKGMKEYLGSVDSRNIDLNGYVAPLRGYCAILDSKSDNDNLLTDLFDYFIASVIIGYLEQCEIESESKVKLLQYYIDELGLKVECTAEEIYANMNEPRIYQLFYEMANDWSGANFWKVQAIAKVEALYYPESTGFEVRVHEFLKMLELDVVGTLKQPKLTGNADKYIINVIKKMMETVKLDIK